MDIEFVCEHCGGILKIQEHLSGQSIECYHCHGMVVVPAAGERAVIEFQCLGCGSPFRVPGSRAGSRTKCPKCGAVLVVPDGSRVVAPPPETSLRSEEPPSPSAANEYLPPPVKSYVRRHGSYRDRRVGTRSGSSGQEGDEDVIAPPADRVPVGMILFWVALGAMLLVGFMLYLNSTDKSGRSGTQLTGYVRYNEASGFFIIRNDDPFQWRSTTVTIRTTAGDYVMNAGDMSPGQALTPDSKQFSGPGGAWSFATAAPTHIIVRAQRPDGQVGEQVIGWGGRRQSTAAPGTSPKKAPAETPAPAPTPPADEGGAVVE